MMSGLLCSTFGSGWCPEGVRARRTHTFVDLTYHEDTRKSGRVWEVRRYPGTIRRIQGVAGMLSTAIPAATTQALGNQARNSVLRKAH